MEIKGKIYKDWFLYRGMVYLYQKIIGEKAYYYLRISKQKGKKLITKDIAYLGSDIENFKKDIELYMIKHYNVCNMDNKELQTLYNKIKEMYNEEIDNFT
jgi:hypothetical protein